VVAEAVSQRRPGCELAKSNDDCFKRKKTKLMVTVDDEADDVRFVSNQTEPVYDLSLNVREAAAQHSYLHVGIARTQRAEPVKKRQRRRR
jgi:hypothetical protein